MKMIKHIYLLLAALSIVACTKLDDNVLATNQVGLPDTIELSFEDSTDDTRVAINEYNQTTWSPGDAISVFYRSTKNLKWQYEGDYETTHASFSYISGDTGTQTSEAITILYPYNEDASVDYSCRYIHTALPATQQYAKNSYGLNGNIMVASGNNTRFKLRSVCGWLRIAIAGADRKISSVSLRGNNGEILAGDIVIDANSAEYTIDNGGSTANKITLKCGNGLALQYAPVYLHIGVLPQTFSKGITVEVKYTDGRTTKLNTTSAMTIARNHIVPMECVDSEGNPISSSVPNNQIWYSATGHVDFENGNYGEVKCINNQFDETTGTGVAIFSASIKSINSIGGSGDNLKSLMLPKSLQYIGYGAFSYCGQLTHLELNEGLEVIDSDAFAFCSQLEQVRIPESVIEIGTNPFAGCESISEFKGGHVSADGHCLVMGNRLIAIAPKASTTYTLSGNIKSIDSYCLMGRSDITELTLPSGLERISDYAFSGASTLNRIHCKSQTPPEIGNQVFAGLTEIYVPINSFEEYIANGWDIYNIYGYDYNTGEIISLWESLGTGIYVEDFFTELLGYDAGYTVPVTIQKSGMDANRIRIYEPFGPEFWQHLNGGIPGFLDFPLIGTIEFDISDPNNVTIVNNPANIGVNVNFSGIGWTPIYLSVEPDYYGAITYKDGAIRFAKDMVCMYYEYQGQLQLLQRANSSGLMSYYLPGAEYANCEMSVEYEGLSEPTNGGTGKAVFTFQTSADVASFKFAFVAGNVTHDPSEVVDAIVEGRSDITIYESIENTATYEVELPDGLWTLVAVPYTAKGTAWTQDAISKYFYITSTGGYPEVDIQVAVGSVVDITGNPAYEENYPSATTMCIYMQADGTQLRSITAFVGTDIPSEMTNEDILAYGEDGSDFIPDMINNGYALVVYHNLTEGTTYDIVLGFETIYGELKTYRMQYTPITTRHTAERYGKEETLAELSNLQFRTFVYPEN